MVSQSQPEGQNGHYAPLLVWMNANLKISEEIRKRKKKKKRENQI